ncbi:hypothetical protein Metev_0611 [Methanohalobium evestigatum Z-7303]|uniref:Carboxypeptidase regulatory-like domain-containing protein n=1 Tax=Methanohalobium evestigatum (strain ATCC BAA-1072 / DSM 3721 / NBRC 107634 / OCM 161 / Z-7303) TaxID=644295 RepID=D7E8H5_METEZ|nr:hypothetical protein [Methanohalobium evestigatum]ADI73517.1 hypothetical protein Metev_0611 [Methanohalobium evestigatum Z-7303]
MNMSKNTFLRTIILISAALVLLAGSASATNESITISSPSNGTTFEHGETVTVYAQTTDPDMTKPMLQTSNNLGTWDPMDQIDNNLFVKTWNTSSLENKNESYIISVKSSLSEQEYFDSIDIEIEESDITHESGSDTKNLTVDGLKDGNTYNINGSIWVQVVDEDTTNPVSNPNIKIQNPSILNTYEGTESGLVKLDWMNLDGEQLDPGKYMVSITAEGYNKEEYLVNLEEPEEEEPEEPELDVMGLDNRVLVNSKTDIWVMDSETGEPVEDATIKMVDKESNTVIRSEKTTDYGEVYWHWDIAGYFTVVVSKPGYDKETTSVRVVHESDIGTHPDFDDSESTSSDDSSGSDNGNDGSDTDTQDKDEDLTLREVQQYLDENHKINGESYQIMSPNEVERIEKRSYQRGYQNGTAAAKEEEGPIAGLILSNPAIAVLIAVALGGLSFAGGAKVGNVRDLNLNPSSLIPDRNPHDEDEDDLIMNNEDVPDIQIPYTSKPEQSSTDDNNEEDQSTGKEQEETQQHSSDTDEKTEERLMELLTPKQKKELLKSIESEDQSNQEVSDSGPDIPEEPSPEELAGEQKQKSKPKPVQPFDTSEYDELAEKMQNKGGW